MTLGFEHLVAFNIALLAALASPGPALIYSICEALTGGVASGLVAALGLATCAALWTAGALFGLGVAVVLALNFVTLRARPDLPIPLLIGCGALIVGVLSSALTGPQAMMQGTIWPMIVTGAVILPVSFVALSVAARHTHASNVSLLMLMETVLAPAWVWLVIGETPTLRMILGGVIVIVSLAFYLLLLRREEQSGN